jgi:hypothetical protein
MTPNAPSMPARNNNQAGFPVFQNTFRSPSRALTSTSCSRRVLAIPGHHYTRVHGLEDEQRVGSLPL